MNVTALKRQRLGPEEAELELRRPECAVLWRQGTLVGATATRREEARPLSPPPREPGPFGFRNGWV